ncbi:MAG: hypothetical protein ACJA0X_003091 [Cyclobacteriaceae bacterium]|jgi:hypothetical protein
MQQIRTKMKTWLKHDALRIDNEKRTAGHKALTALTRSRTIDVVIFITKACQKIGKTDKVNELV